MLSPCPPSMTSSFGGPSKARPLPTAFLGARLSPHALRMAQVPPPRDTSSSSLDQQYLLARDLAVKRLQLESPDRSRGLLLAARACARLGGHLDSCSLAEQALEETGAAGSAGHVEALTWAYGSALLLRSRGGREEEHSSLLDRAVEVLSSVSADEKASVGVLFDHALALAESRRHREALLIATRALQSGGESLPSTWLLLSLILSAQQRPADAIDMCRIGMKTVPFPANAELHMLLGELHKGQGDFAGAVDALKGLLQLVQRQDPTQAEKTVCTQTLSVPK